MKWETLLRYRYIEIICLWEGRLVTSSLCETFGIERQQASREIGHYKALHPENLVYDNRIRGYVPSKVFTPHYVTGGVEEYLHILDSSSLLEGVLEKIAIPETPTHVLRLAPRRIDPSHVRSIVDACRTQTRLEIEYASMSSPEGEERIIAPYVIVSNGYRWHVRAYCEKHREFRDFLLSRVKDVKENLGERLDVCGVDALWEREIELELVPNPVLNEAQQALIRFERNFSGLSHTVKTRAATVVYLLQLMQVPTAMTEAQRNSVEFAKVHPVVLKDYGVIESLRFEER
ncbi:MAG: WYL domain-containing protein [Oceanospirillales bacterium]|nr:WYL domain-containing protein [Oceanospirillales bacterium]